MVNGDDGPDINSIVKERRSQHKSITRAWDVVTLKPEYTLFSTTNAMKRKIKPFYHAPRYPINYQVCLTVRVTVTGRVTL